MTTPATAPNSSPNVDNLREILMEDIHKLRAGETTAANVNAVVNAVGKILTTVKMQMDYARLTGATPQIPLLEPRDRGAGAAA